MAFAHAAVGVLLLSLVRCSSAEDARSLLNIRKSLACDGDYSSLKAGDTCTTTWSKLLKGSHVLRPTEPAVGHAWVVAQMNKHFGSKKDAAKWFAKDTFPVVLGDSNFYLTDRHHHATAIHLTSDDAIWDLDISLTVVCDLRDAGSSFWSEMTKRNYNLLVDRPRGTPFSLPSAVNSSRLPTGWDLSGFTDNMWRSLAGFASHVADDDQRCYRKPCTFYVDYEWAYAMNYATEVDQSLWPTDSNPAAFKAMFEKMSYQPSPKNVDLDAWNTVAEAVLPLCRSAKLKNFAVPSIFLPATHLSGWSAAPVAADPRCPYETCSVLASPNVMV